MAHGGATPPSSSVFLSHGTELWATTELPVAHPLTFRLCYEVDGERYIENNHQRDYVVSKGLLIGAAEYIVPTRQLINIGAQYTLFIELACDLKTLRGLTVTSMMTPHLTQCA